MNPTDFPEANLKLLAPPGMPECLPLSVHRYPPTVRYATAAEEVGGIAGVPTQTLVQDPGGYISRWEPTPEERAAIAAGGPVWVYVVGEGAPPPIAVSGVSPFEAPVAMPPDGKRWASDEPEAPGGTSALRLAEDGVLYVGQETVREGALRTTLARERDTPGGENFARLTRRDAVELAGELLRYANGEEAGVGVGLDAGPTTGVLRCPCGDSTRPGHPTGWCESWRRPTPAIVTADEVYDILSRTDETTCLWCGKPYGEHSDVPLAATPKMPCLGEKAHFVDARISA